MADIEIDVFSGRPNPHSTLSAERAGELLTWLERLEPSDQLPSRPDLGYRGLRVTLEELFPGTILDIYGGVVTLASPGRPVRQLGDPSRAVERWLVDIAAPGMDQQTAEYVRGEITA